MKNVLIAFAILPVLTCATVWAQGEHAPTPAPELKQLSYFVGTWQTDADAKAGPMGPGGKYTATGTYKWQDGNFFLFGNSKFKWPGGTGSEFMIFGYDSEKKVYTYHSFNSGGEYESATGVFQGDTWTWTNAEKGPFQWRYIEKVLSPASFTIRFEMSQDGKNWSTVMEGTAKKL